MSVVINNKRTDKCSCREEDREKSWEWSDCQKEGHEEGCYAVHCIACGYYSLDCEENREGGADMGVMKDTAIKERNEEFIDLTPTKQGYAAMAALFGDNVIGQVNREERDNARALIGSVINIAGHLGNAMAQGDEEAKEAYEWLSAKFPQDKGGK